MIWMQRLLLIDGSSLLSTSFYGLIPEKYKWEKDPEKKKEILLNESMRASNGLYTNGVYRMTETLLHIIQDVKPSHLAVAWDVSRDTFRRKIYPAYKAHRKETPVTLSEQFGTMQYVLEHMNIAQFKLNDYEADDIIGTFANQFHQEIPVRILSKDQDVLQLVNDQIFVWMIASKVGSREHLNESTPRNTGVFTHSFVNEHYGLNPIQIIDKKALEGDASDNIPGVKGVGEKASVPLIREYETVERLYEVLDELDAKSLKILKVELKEKGMTGLPFAKLMATSEDENELIGKKAAILSKQLATIKCDIAELKHVRLDSLVLSPNFENARKVFTELDFKSLMNKI